jgi:hypothetical protein
LKLLEGVCRAMSDRLHERVAEAARAGGCPRVPEDTSSIYAMAMDTVPGLLDELICAHQLASQERGEMAPRRNAVPPLNDLERKRMLSAVRAAVYRRSRSRSLSR